MGSALIVSQRVAGALIGTPTYNRPHPLPMSPSRMGTSVSVAKYMKAPTTDANRFARSVLPPTRLDTHSDGMRPS